MLIVNNMMDVPLFEIYTLFDMYVYTLLNIQFSKCKHYETARTMKNNMFIGPLGNSAEPLSRNPQGVISCISPIVPSQISRGFSPDIT